MSAPMQPCEGCGRHMKATSIRCPFCDRLGSKRAAKVGSAATTAAAVAVGIALSACYGGPPRPMGPPPSDPNTVPNSAPTIDPSGTPIAPDPK